MSENTDEHLFFNVKDELKLVKEWLKTQEYLPQNIDDIVLKNYLTCCEGDVKNATDLIRKNFIHRSKSPDFFKTRDVCEDLTQTYLTHSDAVILPRRSQDNSSIILVRHVDNYRNLTMSGLYKGTSLMYDLFSTDESLNSSSAIYIHDLSRSSLMHLTRFYPLSAIKSYMHFIQECLPIKMTQVHIINVPWFWEKIMNLLKPLIKPEITKMLHIHSNMETLYKYVPKENLPEDYGGYLKSIEELSTIWSEKLNDKRKYFLDESKWWVNEEKLKEHLEIKEKGNKTQI